MPRAGALYARVPACASTICQMAQKIHVGVPAAHQGRGQHGEQQGVFHGGSVSLGGPAVKVEIKFWNRRLVATPAYQTPSLPPIIAHPSRPSQN